MGVFLRAKTILQLFTAVLVLGNSAALATDHIDGSNTVYDPSVDLTDLYAFTTDENDPKLVLILNAVTAAMAKLPSPEAYFNIFLAAADENPDASGYQLSTELPYQISCVWLNEQISCQFPSGRLLEVALDEITPPAAIRVFAGLRSDPFYLNGRWAMELQSGSVIPPAFSSNSIENLNVYGIVIEIDLDELPDALSEGVIAVGAEVMNSAGVVSDRVGRPEIANIAIQATGADDLRNALNAQRALEVAPDLRDILEIRLRQNLDRYDSLSPSGFRSNKDNLARILADDYLLIDTRLPCREGKYFELEMAYLEARAPENCGGRGLNEDIIDAVYGLLINGTVNDPVPDGADAPTLAPLNEFPYLAPPNTGMKTWFAAVTGRILAALSVEGPRRILILAFAVMIILIPVLILGKFAARKFRSKA